MGQEACGEGGAAANIVLRLKNICAILEEIMMKKLTKRVLSTMLALLLLLSMPMTARATVVEDAAVPTARTTWEANFQQCIGTVWIPGGQYMVPVPITDATVVTIVSGEQKVITWPEGNGAIQSRVLEGVPALADMARVNALLTELGYGNISMRRDLEPEDADLIFFETPAGLPRNDYSYGSEFQVIDAKWMIERGQLQGRAITPDEGDDSGDITGIPISCTAIKLIVMSQS